MDGNRVRRPLRCVGLTIAALARPYVANPYATGALRNAPSGGTHGGLGSGNQLGRIDIAVAPGNPDYIYAQVASIAANNNSGCGNAAGRQLGAFASIDGGATSAFMAGSAGGSLRACASARTCNSDLLLIHDDGGVYGKTPEGSRNQDPETDPLFSFWCFAKLPSLHT